MRIRIRVYTGFGWGETRSHDLGMVERDPIGALDEDFGLSLAEGKSLLKEIQRVLLQAVSRRDQMNWVPTRMCVETVRFRYFWIVLTFARGPSINEETSRSSWVRWRTEQAQNAALG